MKTDRNDLGHMTKTAAMPIYRKTLSLQIRWIDCLEICCVAVS